MGGNWWNLLSSNIKRCWRNYYNSEKMATHQLKAEIKNMSNNPSTIPQITACWCLKMKADRAKVVTQEETCNYCDNNPFDTIFSKLRPYLLSWYVGTTPTHIRQHLSNCKTCLFIEGFRGQNPRENTMEVTLRRRSTLITSETGILGFICVSLNELVSLSYSIVILPYILYLMAQDFDRKVGCSNAF